MVRCCVHQGFADLTPHILANLLLVLGAVSVKVREKLVVTDDLALFEKGEKRLRLDGQVHEQPSNGASESACVSSKDLLAVS